MLHDSVTLLYVSKYFRKYILDKNYKYFYLASGFCSLKYWENNIGKKAFDLLQNIYNNDDFTCVFDFEKFFPEVEVTLRDLSLFSVCFHFLTCLRSCDKVANYCFYCSHVRSHVYGDWCHFHDVEVATQDKVYNDHYMYTQVKICDFDVFLGRPIYMNYPNYPFNQRTCDYYNELHHAQDLFVPFTSVLIRMYINYVSKYFFKFQFKLRDEKIVYDAIYLYASRLIYEFFDINYVFFYEFLNMFNNFNRSHCLKINKLKKKIGPYDITAHLG